MTATSPRETLPRETDVLVVGAGPTGLTAATALRRLGVDVTLLDAAAGIRTESRAAGVQPRTLEQLARIGVADALIDRGLRGEGFVAATPDETLVRIPFGDLDTPYPFVLLVPQHDTEQVFGEALTKAGGHVLRAHRVLDVDPGYDAVDVSVADPDGLVRSIRARYVIGCDGLHSGVRTGAGIEFTGEQGAQHNALADIRATGLEGPPTVRFTFSPHGMLLLSPLPDGLLRVVATVHEPAAGYDRDAVQRLLDERGPADTPLRVDEVVQSSPYRVSTRLAERFRAGRIFLAGDAAHVHSPAGGQGMNTGIQDAVNLAWKLAAVLDGTAPPELLDSYDPERRPVAAGLLGFTAQLTALAELDQPVTMRLRDQVLRAAGQVKELPDFLARKMSQLDVRYPAPGNDDRVGTRIPPHGAWATTLHWALLLPSGDQHSAASLPQKPNVTIGASPTDTAFLVRPDGYVAATSTDLSEVALRGLVSPR
jgi:2-polyprenyl-6-methoxyphenol hydroxylase-like FAD-dependent oxidoreductase